MKGAVMLPKTFKKKGKGKRVKAQKMRFLEKQTARAEFQPSRYELRKRKRYEEVTGE
jgi:hypothetical protein